MNEAEVNALIIKSQRSLKVAKKLHNDGEFDFSVSTTHLRIVIWEIMRSWNHSWKKMPGRYLALRKLFVLKLRK